MASRIPSQNVAAILKHRASAGYANKVEYDRLRMWRLMLADGRLTPDMLSPEERVQLQTWILDHPKRKAAP